MGTKGSANRQRIVDAADHLFYSRGYNQTSFSDISDETGIPRGNFYYYFKTKEDILAAVVDARLVEFKGMLKSCEDITTDPLERLHALTQFPLQREAQVLQYGCPIGSLSSELVKEQDTEISHARLTAVFDLLKSWIEEQLSQLGQDTRSDEVAKDLLAKMQGIIIIANVYNDADFLHRGIKDIQSWLNQTLSN
ncbi:MAG: TetR family transcriptional regulator [endosymbiont of Galathealinum brachiosum]|uniref:TetR family transcriptional regulator n=1 Tax=endosymbiont of Galathealinum brachiosum TaxID=2200906 RepID=A0A370D9D8_9GAMM|nr:MAG: TetR family transcriptional regulator [endosymbiont of Galathealinum brachiosum]